MGETNCVFCRIVRREVPAQIVYETSRILAFQDIQPVAPVHVLLIPREHIVDPSALTEDNAAVMGEMFIVARDVAAQLGVADTGYRLVMNKGRFGGQSVFHMHLHLLAGRQMTWPPG